MQQRVGLARALASDPEVLLMDEPFSALDLLIRRQLQDQFLSLSANLNKSTMFITHDLDEAIRIGNRIAIMKDGRIVQIGTPEAIVTIPIHDYVRDFVEGISTRKLVFAHSIMERIDAYKPRAGEDLGGRLCASGPERLQAARGRRPEPRAQGRLRHRPERTDRPRLTGPS